MGAAVPVSGECLRFRLPPRTSPSASSSTASMAGRAALLEPACSYRRSNSGSSLSSSSGLGTSATLFTDLSLVGVETGVGSLQLAGTKHAALFGEADGMGLTL